MTKRKNTVFPTQVVTIAPLDFSMKESFGLEPLFRRKLLNHPITIGDFVVVLRERVFEIVDMKPQKTCIFRLKTEIRILNEPMERSLESQEEATKRAISQYNSNTSLWNTLAYIYCEKGEYKMAVGAWEQADKIKPQRGTPLTKLGNYFHRKGEINKAIDTYKEAIEADPQDKDAYLFLGVLYKMQDNLEEALDIYHRVISFYPESSIAWTNLCHIYTIQNKLDQALKAGIRALEFKPIKETWFYLGNVYHKKGDIKNAIKNLKKAIRRGYQFKEALYLLSQVYFDSRQNKKALKICNKCLKIDPDFDDGQQLKEEIIKTLSLNTNS